MARAFSILSQKEQELHNAPPRLNADRRKYSFYQSQDLLNLLEKIRTVPNKIYFTLSYGYFKETAQFYDSSHSRDIAYVAKQFNFDPAQLDFENYGRVAKNNHRMTILNFFSFSPFELKAIKMVEAETVKALRSRKSPKTCFREVIDFLKQERIEIPRYEKLSLLISNHYNDHKSELVEVVRKHLSKGAREVLDQLTEKPDQDKLAPNTYSLTLAQRFSHSTKASKIRKNVELHQKLYEIFELTKPVLEKLNLNEEGIRSFAALTEYSQVFQIQRRKDDDRYLHLIVFVANQFYRLQDILVLTLIRVMTTTWNQSLKEAKEEFYNLGLDIQTLTEKLLKQTDDIATQLNKVRKTLESPLISDKEKVEASLQIINRRNRSDSELRAEIDSLRGNYQTLNKDVVFAKILARKFRTISGKCKGIILNLTYCFDGSDKYLSAAIKNYIQYNGNVDLNMSPKGFLSKKELSILAMLDSDKVSLYKMYFFKYLSDGFKSGAINLNNAFEYTTLESNLITREFFNKNFDSILLQTGLNEIANIDDVLRQHELETNALFEQVNIAIERGSNSYVVAEDGGGYHTSPERNISLQDDLEEKKLELYPKTKLISIAEAISTVNSATQFLDAFEHIVHKHLKSKPENKMFFAAIMALGCNFGTRALAKHAEGINPTILKTTADAYFSVENIRNASDKILEFVDKLPVANLFRSEHAVHTSSDGQKWIVSYDSLNANFSFKYGGKDLVLSAYTFIDSRNLFFHSNVFSGAQYEAHYMIDGVLRNRVVKSKIHSTDTHGYTDAVFGLSHILGISFAPRLRDVARRQLFSFEPRSKYRKKGYTVLPQGEIDKELIREQYKEILRIAASIKLGETSASQVFKRLNSYTPKNPLYRAIKEFGKIIKTKHILNYLDDPEYRTEITRQLNKGELGNKMDRAIAIGNPEYSEVLKDSQEQTESCRRLLKNVMVCWNYMHLSQLLIDSKSEKSKSKIIQRVLVTSTASWAHFLVNGIFEFSERHLSDSRHFQVEKMFDPSIVIVKR